MKSNVSRSMRRKVSNAIHAYYEATGGGFGSGGFCSAISVMQERIYKNSGDPALSKAMQALRDEIMHTAVAGPYAYLPHAMLFRTQEQAKASPQPSEEYKERIRRTWLRHWTEVGVILNHDRWQGMQANRMALRAERRAAKPALATESVRDYA